MNVAIHIAVALLMGLLIWLSIIDIQQRRLPNKLVLAVAALGLVLATAQCLHTSSFAPLKSSLLGALLSAGPALAFSLAYFLACKHEGFGFGDIKLLAALGIFLGPIGLALLPIACVLASMVSLPRLLAQTIAITYKETQKKTQRHTIAFGPYISISAAILLWLFIV